MKIDIISGFLGAGKTTFIKELLTKGYKDEKVVLIENEFGEVAIDSHLMDDYEIDVTEMNSGCICCTLAGDFARALKDVTTTYKPDRIIIEPSGVGKLSDVMKAVLSVEHEIGAELGGRITVVDGKKAAMYMKNFGEFFNDQIKNATTLVISRSQLMDEDKLTKCIKLLRTENDEASVIATPWDKLDAEVLREALEATGHVEEELLGHEEHCHGDLHYGEHHHHEEDHDHHNHHHHEEDHGHHEHHHHEEDHDHHDEHHHDHSHDCDCGCHHDHDHAHDHHDHHDHHHADEIFTSWGIETVHKFDRHELEDALKLLSMTEELGVILRAKGIVQCDDDKWVEFNMTPEEINIEECKENYIGRLCIIGTDIKKEEIERIFGK